MSAFLSKAYAFIRAHESARLGLDVLLGFVLGLVV